MFTSLNGPGLTLQPPFVSCGPAHSPAIFLHPLTSIPNAPSPLLPPRSITFIGKTFPRSSGSTECSPWSRLNTCKLRADYAPAWPAMFPWTPCISGTIHSLSRGLQAPPHQVWPGLLPPTPPPITPPSPDKSPCSVPPAGSSLPSAFEHNPLSILGTQAQVSPPLKAQLYLMCPPLASPCSFFLL